MEEADEKKQQLYTLEGEGETLDRTRVWMAPHGRNAPKADIVCFRFNNSIENVLDLDCGKDAAE